MPRSILPPLYFVPFILFGCSDTDSTATDGRPDLGIVDVGSVNDVGLPDLGPEDLGRPQLSEVQSPELTPCPEGWSESEGVDGVTTCEPWPDATPVQWDCPEDWVGDADGACQPGSDWGPVQWTCPQGWEPVAVGTVTACEPLPGPDVTCGPYEARFPGQTGCSSVGAVCPAGDFADNLPTGVPLIYVQPGAASPGDGSSPAEPLIALSQVPFEQLSEGTVVALSKGTHEGPVELMPGITLWGACPEDTALTASSPTSATALVTAVGPAGQAASLVRDLRIEDAPVAGIEVTRVGNLQVEGVVVQRTRGAGVLVLGQFDGARLLVRDTLSNADGPGYGLRVDSGRATVRQAIVERNAATQVVSEGPNGSLVLEEAIIRNAPVFAGPGLSGVYGLHLRRRGALEGRRILVEGMHDYGVFVSGLFSNATIEDFVVRDGEGPDARGLGAVEFAQLTLRRGLVRDRARNAIIVSGTSTFAQLENVITADTRLRSGDVGYGFIVQESARATVSRFASIRDGTRGLYAIEAARLAVNDALVEDLKPRPRDNRATGLDVGRSSQATVNRLVLKSTGAFGGLEIREEASANVNDLVVDTSAQFSLFVYRNASVDITGALLRNSVDSATFCQTGGAITMKDVVVRSDAPGLPPVYRLFVGLGQARLEVERANLQVEESGGIFVTGDGSEVEAKAIRVTGSETPFRVLGGALAVAGGELDLEQAHLARPGAFGIGASGADSTVRLENIVIDDPAEGRVVGTNFAAGYGLVFENRAVATVGRIRVRRAATAAVRAETQATLDISDAVLQESSGQKLDGRFGFGVWAQGAELTLNRAIVSSARGYGVFVDSGNPATLRDILILNTDLEDCADLERCNSYGVGLGGRNGRANLARLQIDLSRTCGLHALAGAVFTTSGEVLISRNSVAVCPNGALDTESLELRLESNIEDEGAAPPSAPEDPPALDINPFD